jgi:hypothetical protein
MPPCLRALSGPRLTYCGTSASSTMPIGNGSGTARRPTRRSRRRRPHRHGQSRRQFLNRPRRLGEQGWRVVVEGTGGLVCRRRRDHVARAGRPTGQHIELGIAETNLVSMIGVGATLSRWGEPLLPIGVLYDPFVECALEPWSSGIYAGGQSILVGTPSGVTLAPGAEPTSRSPPPRSASNGPNSSRMKQHSSSTSNGFCCDACPVWGDPTARRPT